MAIKMEKICPHEPQKQLKMLALNGACGRSDDRGRQRWQIWRAVPAEAPADCELVNKATGFALTVPGEGGEWRCSPLPAPRGSADQLWKLTTTTRGFPQLMHAASGKVVDIKDQRFRLRAGAQLWEFIQGRESGLGRHRGRKGPEGAVKRAVRGGQGREARKGAGQGRGNQMGRRKKRK